MLHSLLSPLPPPCSQLIPRNSRWPAVKVPTLSTLCSLTLASSSPPDDGCRVRDIINYVVVCRRLCASLNKGEGYPPPCTSSPLLLRCPPAPQWAGAGRHSPRAPVLDWTRHQQSVTTTTRLGGGVGGATHRPASVQCQQTQSGSQSARGGRGVGIKEWCGVGGGGGSCKDVTATPPSTWERGIESASFPHPSTPHCPSHSNLG